MNVWMKRGLRTALLTGGLLAVGTGVASADENDLVVDVTGVTVTVPVTDGAVLDLPLETGTGSDLAVGGGAEPLLELPIDTNTPTGTTVDLGRDSAGGDLGVPVTVAPADGSAPDPDDGLTVTVPVDTAGPGSDVGTTVVVPIVTGDLGSVLDGDPTTGNDIDVNLHDLLVVRDPADPAAPGLFLDVEDLVTIGDTDGTTAPDEVLAVPVSAEEGEDTTVSLPAPTGGASDGFLDGLLDGDVLVGNDVDVNLGRLISDGTEAPEGATVVSDPLLSLPIGTGGLLDGIGSGGLLAGNDVAVNLTDLLVVCGGAGGGTGSVITVPINEGSDGTGGDNLVVVTLPIGLGGPEDGDGGAGPGTHAGPGTDSGRGSGSDGAGTVPAARSLLPVGTSSAAGNGHDASAADGGLAYTGTDVGGPLLAGLLALVLGLALTLVASRRESDLR